MKTFLVFVGEFIVAAMIYSVFSAVMFHRRQEGVNRVVEVVKTQGWEACSSAAARESGPLTVIRCDTIPGVVYKGNHSKAHLYVTAELRRPFLEPRPDIWVLINN